MNADEMVGLMIEGAVWFWAVILFPIWFPVWLYRKVQEILK